MAALTSCESALFPMAYPEGGFGRSGRPPPPSPASPPNRPDPCLRLKFLYRQDSISLFNWLIFLIKRALHFATKQHSRDIQKYNCFWVPSYDLFASARKAVFSAPKATGVHRLIEKCVAVSAFSAGHKKAKQSILYQIWTSPSPPPPPTKNSWIRPWFHRKKSVKFFFLN